MTSSDPPCGGPEDWLRSFHTLPTEKGGAVGASAPESRPSGQDAASPWPRTVLEHLAQRFPAVTIAEWEARCARGRIAWDDGTPITATSAYQPGRRLVYRREVPDEPEPTEAPTIVHVDDRLLVLDKPPGIPVTPSGRFVRRSLLFQARRALANPHLIAAHRIDLETAGLVLFVQRPEDRAVYQALFAQRAVHKVYAAIGAGRGEPPAFTTVRSRIERTDDPFRWRSVPDPQGEAVSDVYTIGLRNRTGVEADAAGSSSAWTFRVVPESGRPHQVRLHLAQLGFPVIGDPLYPQRRLIPPTEGPLRLVAAELRFRDPHTGAWRFFASGRRVR